MACGIPLVLGKVNSVQIARITGLIARRSQLWYQLVLLGMPTAGRVYEAGHPFEIKIMM